MRRIMLHVGMHKTGTTSLQSLLHHNYSVLLSQHVLTPLSYMNHSSLLVPVFKRRLADYAHAIELARSRRDSDLEHLRDFSRSTLVDILSAPWTGWLILVAEDVSSMLDDDEKKSLLETLLGYCDELQVIGFVRDPHSFIASMMVQLLRNRHVYSRIVSDDELLLSVLPHYRERFEFLSEFRSAGYAFELHPHRSPEHPANPVAVVLQRLGLDRAPLSYEGIKMNASLSACGQQYLNCLNALCPSLDAHHPHPGWRVDAVEVAEQLVPSVALQPIVDPSDVERLSALASKDYQWVGKLVAL